MKKDSLLLYLLQPLIGEPSKGDADHPAFEYNTFNVCFLLKK
jgi:hypothetical protein